MTTDVPIHGSWKANSKDENDLIFLSVNVNSLAHWSQESNKAERLKYIFEKYSIDSAGLQEVHELGTFTPYIDTGTDTSKNTGRHMLCGIIQQKGGQRSRDREGPTGRYVHNIERATSNPK